jgi:hypothetical protein
MKRTLHQNKQLHAIAGKLNIQKDVMEDLVYQFTNERETSTKEMDMMECQALINHLRVMTGQRVEVVPTPAPRRENSPENRMRKKVISLCYDLHMTLPGGKIDMARVNALCVEKGPAKKPLNACTKQELQVLITVVEKIVKSYLERYAKG